MASRPISCCRRLSDLPEYGEGALKNCLPYDEVPKARFTKWSDSNHQLFVDELKRRSETRVAGEPGISLRHGRHGTAPQAAG